MVIYKPTEQKEIPKLELSKQPDGFYIIVDSREQSPYFLDLDYAVVKGLRTGDYSIKGFEDEITIERKGVEDLLGCIGKDRKRFKKELERMGGMKWKGLVIEGAEFDLFTSTRSSLSIGSIRWSMISFEMRYGLHIYYAKSRKDGARWIHDRLVYWYTRRREGKLI